MGIQAAAFVVLLPLLALAAAEDSYEAGFNAAQKGNWGDVVRYMRAAIAERPKEGGRVRLYGMNFVPYLPHYYLGLAHFRLNDCESALREWRTSEGDGAIQRERGLYQGLLQSKGLCEQRVASTKTPAPPTPAPTAVASVAAATPSPPPPTPAPATPAPVVAAAQKPAGELARVENAVQRIGSLASDPNLGPIWAQDPSLGPAFLNVRRALDSARAKLERGRSEGNVELVNAGTAELGQIKDQIDAIQAAAARASERVRAARASLPTPSPSALLTPTGPPPELLAAVQAYFGNRYAEVLRLLPGAGSNGDARVALQGLVLRCAARYNLYVLGGETRADLLQQAKDDARAARRLNASYLPDKKYFSPRFVEFFQAAY